MGNTISLPEEIKHLAEPLGMSNGLTSVFIEVLALSGSILAETNREKELIIWLAQQDQSVVGLGTVGFCIDEMPWTTDSFDREKNFMLRAISGAVDGLGWERLDAAPQKEPVVGCLKKFYSLIKVFDIENVNLDSYIEWSEIEEEDDTPTIPRGYPKCEIHDVYLSCHGCILCNI
ncbi:hypothetical protein M3231_11100 [Neobacillus mesonae]|nr:hypothetical protein [Neobacillus mesonae]